MNRFLAAVFVLSCSGSEPAESLRQSITSGTPDDADTSAVFVVAKSGAATGYCSGVVISPHVVLTAAHCATADFEYSIFLGADYNDPSAQALAENFVAVAEHHGHPKWSTSSGDVNDIGVLITAAPLPRPAAAINRTPIKPNDIGRALRIVGFGQTSGSDKTIGRRNVGATTIAGLDATTLEIDGAPNICLFDSGGPSFLNRDGTDVVAGIHIVVSSTACDGQGYDTRVDAYTSFIDAYVNAADPPDAGAPEIDAGAASDDAGSSDAGVTSPSSGCAIAGSRPPSAFYAFLLGWFLVSRRQPRTERAIIRAAPRARPSSKQAHAQAPCGWHHQMRSRSRA